MHISKEISNTTWRFCNSWRSWDVALDNVSRSSTAFTRRTMIYDSLQTRSGFGGYAQRGYRLSFLNLVNIFKRKKV